MKLSDIAAGTVDIREKVIWVRVPKELQESMVEGLNLIGPKFKEMGAHFVFVLPDNCSLVDLSDEKLEKIGLRRIEKDKQFPKEGNSNA